MPTFGIPSPNSVTQNLDVVLTLAFANSGDAIFDAISKNNAIFHEIKQSGMYEGIDAPEPYIEVPLMYGLGQMEWYEGWDVLSTLPTEGVTAALYPWRQAACPSGYNRRESRTTNPRKIKDIAKLKIQQAQMTMAEGWNIAFLQGNIANPGGTLIQSYVSATTGRSGIEPLPSLIYYATGTGGAITQPSASHEVGGINQNVRAWWRNWCMTSAATTYQGMLLEWDKMVTRCSRGPGGPPTVIYTDETTRSLLNAAYYQVYRRSLERDNDYPFDNLKFRNARVVVDESIPDVESGTGNTDTYGTAYFVNSKFLKVKYDTACNFILTDLQKPVNQDCKIGHVMWMGNTVMNNRRKHGVIGKIARTLTVA